MVETGVNTESRPEELVLVGTVAGTHGLDGEFRVFPLSDNPERLLDLERLYLGESVESAMRYKVLGTPRFHSYKGKRFLLVRLKGFTTIESAQRINAQSVFALESDIPLDEDEIFLDELLGFTAVDQIGNELGTVTAVRSMPAHPVLVLELSGGKSVMIPAIPEFVTDVDADKRCVHVNAIEGLLE